MAIETQSTKQQNRTEQQQLLRIPTGWRQPSWLFTLIIAAEPGITGCLPFSQRIRIFRFEVKWKGNFPENLFGNCGPPEVVLFFRLERNLRNALTICENPSVSRPFLTRSSKICGMECCVVNGKRHSHPVGH